jgi:uncharacterized membrane protein YeaQ/YmgE (transglycosylase-associated protein family)
MSVIGLLLTLLIFVLVGLVVRWAMSQLGVPGNIQNVVMLIFGLIVLLWLIQALGVLTYLADGPVLRVR